MWIARPRLTFYEKLYFPAIMAGLWTTLKHFLHTWGLLLKKKKHPHSPLTMSECGLVTMQYPKEKWPLPEGYRGVPVLVKDEEGREKCVACQLCEFVCPPRAIRITPSEISATHSHACVEKAPCAFEIDMLRCIYCGLCEEVCPEEAIFLKKDIYALNGGSRKEMMHDKNKLYELGGVKIRPIQKWKNK
ncbi:MAG: NuoI/complex I 23 kDa subunit family protein [Verrucomicrobiota bacterium]